jgi:hypothetical protein
MPDEPNGEVNEAFVREGYGFFNRVTDPQLYQRIAARVTSRGYFTDRVTLERVSVRLSDIALVISPSRRLAFVSHARPTRLGSTGTRGFRASLPILVDISFDELTAAVSDEHVETVTRGFDEPCFRPPSPAWDAIWDAIRRLRPQFADQLRRIEQLRFDDSFEFDESSDDEQVFYEKDAVGVALDVAGISFNGVFAELSEGRQQDKNLVEALCGNPTEDVVLHHDVHNFPEYTLQADRLHAWLNRTQFTDLVAKGWIGTNNVTQDALATYVESALESRRSVLIAVGEARRSGGGDDEVESESDDF